MSATDPLSSPPLRNISEPAAVGGPLPAFLPAAAAGILFDALWAPPILVWGSFFLFAFLFLIASGAACRKRGAPRYRKTILFSAAAAVVFAFFGFWHQISWSYFPKDEIGFQIPAGNMPAEIEGVIRTTPIFYETPHDESGGMTLVEVETVRFRNLGKWVRCSGRVAVRGKGDLTHFRIGDAVRVTGKIAHIRGPDNPGAFDRAARARARRILTTMIGASIRKTERLAGMPRYTILAQTERVRLAARDLFLSRLSPRSGAVASAVVLGLRSDLDEETLGIFRRTGTSHLISVSGLHVTFVSFFLFLAIRALRLSPRTRAVLAALAILAYVLLAGAQAPAIRAAVLFWVLCLSILFRRKPLLLNTFAVSALVILLISPANIFQPGVHFSFLATGVFLWIFRPVRPPARPVTFLLRLRIRFRLLHLQFRSRPFAALLLRMIETAGGGFFRTMAASLIIELVLLPVILTHVHLCTPLSFLINPIVWLPFEAALILAILLLFVGRVPFLGAAVAWLADKAFSLLTALLGVSAEIPRAWFRVPGPSLWWTLGFYLPLVFWTLFPKYRPRPQGILLLALVWLLVGASAAGIDTYVTRLRRRVDIEILSVGHGGANLILFPQKTVLYDCGTMGDGARAGRTVASALFARGRASVDLVFLSHADADHYNGLVELLDEVRVGRVMTPPNFFRKENASLAELREALERKKVPILSVGAGEDLTPYGFGELTVLHPEKETESDATNAASLTLSLEHLGRRVLLTGDLDTADTPGFLKNDPPTYDLIAIPHHGGRSQSTEPLLRKLAPAYAAVSEVDGRLSAETLDAWRAWDPELSVLSTGNCGAIKVRIEKNGDGSDFTLTPYRYPAR